VIPLLPSRPVGLCGEPSSGGEGRTEIAGPFVRRFVAGEYNRRMGRYAFAILAAVVLIGGASGCGGPKFTPPAEWRVVEPDLSNLRGTYVNGALGDGLYTLWESVAPASRMAHWSDRGDRVAVDPVGDGRLRCRLIRGGTVIDEVRAKCERGKNYVSLASYSRRQGDLIVGTTTTRRTWLCVDGTGALCVRFFGYRYNLFGDDGGGWSSGRYERATGDLIP